jgi:FkbM family methyltransferase
LARAAARGLLKKILLRLYHTLVRCARLRPVQVRKAFQVFAEPISALLYYVALKGIRSPIRIGLKGGGSYRLEFGDDFLVLWSAWVDEEYPLAGGEAVIFDAGANLGAFALYAAHTCPRAQVYALEPVATTFRKLEGNLASAPDASKGRRITALQAGVAGTSGVREIYAAERSPYSSFYAGGAGAAGAAGVASAAGVEQVKVLSLADWIEAAGVSGQVDFLKMDCEGAEMETLLGAGPETLRRFNRIIFEFHEISGIPYARVADHLSAAGFVCRSSRRDPRSRTGIARFDRA